MCRFEEKQNTKEWDLIFSNLMMNNLNQDSKILINDTSVYVVGKSREKRQLIEF